jgi:hypothetical protein
MPAPQIHVSFALSVATRNDVPHEMRRAAEREPVYLRLGSIFHDLPYYGNMLAETVRYGLDQPALDEPWAYRMHSMRPGHFVASYIRAAAASALSRDEKRALVAGLLSHCALDLTLHPLVNYCARRDVAEMGGHESTHHRRAEKMQALHFHIEQLGRDPIGRSEFLEWTRVVKAGSFVRARAEASIVGFMRDAYQGAYGNAPSAQKWTGWVRSFRHFGLLVAGPHAARNSRRLRASEELRARYFANAAFDFYSFYRCSERRLGELLALGLDYLEAGDFSRSSEETFVAAARIDDLAEPEPQANDRLPELPRLAVTCTPGQTRPAAALLREAA